MARELAEERVPSSADAAVAADARAELARWLLKHRNADGGWGYRPGRPSRLEPTSLALLAARDEEPDAAGEVFGRWPVRDRVLVEGPSRAVNYAFAGLAAVVWLRGSNAPNTSREALLGALTRARGVALPQLDPLHQDNRLQGWSWTPDAFSWVEPTAWCLLALKRWRRLGGQHADLDARIEVGNQLLQDRAIDTGGWNYGNKMVYGKVLQAFVPTTAFALLALGDLPRAPECQRGLAWLHSNRLGEPSPLALGWAAIALTRLGSDAADVRRRLVLEAAVTMRHGDVAAAATVAAGLADRKEDDPFGL